MNFAQLKIFGSFIAKDYALDLFSLLLDYKSISSSEAASRLGLHIKTVQEFFEGMTEAELLIKEEVYEKKRPYNRYSLKQKKINISINLEDISKDQCEDQSVLSMKIKEKRNSGLSFTIARDGNYLSSCSIMIGKGREKKGKKVNLTISQGKFLYKLPFPDGMPISIKELIKEAKITEEYEQEIINIVQYLKELDVIEFS